MNEKLICSVARESSTYEVIISSGLLQKLFLNIKFFGKRFVIITDDHVKTLYGIPLYEALTTAGVEVHLCSFMHGEENKTRETKQLLEDQLFEKGLGRDTCLIALGGGVVLDLSGYIAATYCRGIPLVMVPTTLLGMVDACIGGKTAVNVSYGKNLIGAIYQPSKVLIDPSLLKTLPLKEFSNGVIEMIKHGLIGDSCFFEYLESHSEELMGLNLNVIEQTIFESCRIKKEIVEVDEQDLGRRHLLNFGHTIGHALECLTSFSLSHGEAVAIGLLVESHISLQLGYLQQSAFDRIKNIITQYGVTYQLSKIISFESMKKVMKLDKKSKDGKPRFVILQEIGAPLITNAGCSIPVEEDCLKEAINWMNHDLSGH